MSTQKKKFYSYAKLLCFFSLVLFACGRPSSSPVVTPIKRSSQLGTVNEIIGTYGPACIDRVGQWSIRINDACPPSDIPALSVAQGDSHCTLTIRSVLLDCTRYETTGLDILDSYHTYGVPFYAAGDCDVAFYANALLPNPISGVSFLIKFIYSKGLAESSSVAISKYDTIVSLVLANNVPPPDYTADTILLDLKVDILNKVTQSNGIIALIPGIQTGESFIVVNTLSASQKNYAFVHHLFQSSSPIPITLSLNASLFTLLNQTLSVVNPVQRDIIIVHTDPISHVSSYEVITITFLPATTF